MRHRIIRFVNNNTLVRRFMSAPTPWVSVLITDIILVAFSCLITYSFSPTASLGQPGWIYTPFAQGLFAAAAYLVLMPLIHTYKYIVRLSVVKDLYRVALLVCSATVLLLAVCIACAFTTGVPYFGIWNIFVVMLMTFTLLMSVRLGVKYVYRLLNGIRQQRTPVIALGSGANNSFSFVSALNNDPEGRFKVVAMIALSSDRRLRTLDELPVYSYDPASLEDIFDEYGCREVIFPSGLLNAMRSGMADEFLKHHTKMHIYAQVQDIDPRTGRELAAAGSVRDIRIEDLLGREVIQPDTTEAEEVLRGQVVMITGAAGSIGSEIVHQVANLHAREIVLLDQAETPMHELQLLMEEKHPDTLIHLFIADVANRDRLEQAFRRYRPRYVFHAAAYKHVPMMERNPSEAILTNVFGSKNVADLAVKYHVEKFVMISTDKAVNPTNVMGASKRIAEIYVQSLYHHNRDESDGPTTQFITTRFGNVLGSNGSVIPLFRKQIEQGGPVTVTHRDIIRYFMTIPEACSLVLQAGTMGSGGEIFVFDMGQPVKIYDLAVRMISLSGMRPGTDIEIIETGLRPGEKLYEELLNDRELTMATRNSKIMIAKVRKYQYEEVCGHLDTLLGCTQRGDYHDIVAEMKHIVPEFKSKNSQWEAVDREIANDEVMKEIPV